MKKASLVMFGLFSLASGTILAQSLSRGEQLEKVIAYWPATMEQVRIDAGASEDEFATFKRFYGHMIDSVYAEFRGKINSNAIGVTNAEEYVQGKKPFFAGLFKNFKQVEYDYPSSVSEFRTERRPRIGGDSCFTSCYNTGFEDGTFNGWYGYYGVNSSSSLAFTITNITGGYMGPVAEGALDPYTGNDYQLRITSGTATDVFLNTYSTYSMPQVSPFGGSHSVMMGDSNRNGQGVAILSQTFMVSSSASNLSLEYSLFLENPAGHTYYEQPFFSAVVLDQNGDTIPACGEYLISAYPSGNDFKGIWYPVEGDSVYWKPWTAVNVSLKNYIGQCVTVIFQVQDCSLGGHFGYAYVDASCSPMAIASSSPNICGQDSISLTAPPLGSRYSWLGPVNGIISNDTLQTVWVDSAGTYSVVCIPPTGASCADTLTITVGKLAGTPPHPKFTAPVVCEGQPTQFTNISNPISGTFNWDFYNLGTWNDTNVVNPTWTYGLPGLYTVKLQEIVNGCGTDTLITVRVDSNIVAGFTATSTCLGSPAILTNTSKGSTGYKWNFGDPSSGPNDSSVAITGAHTYATAGTYTVTLIATNGSCTDSISKAVTVSPVPRPVVTGQDSICPGTKDTLTVTGGTTYLWQNAATSSTIIVAPTTTKTITVTAYNGTCSYDTAFVIHVVSTPSLTVAASPGIISLGDSSVLSAHCSVNAVYSWAPSASVRNPSSAHTEATPTVTTTYTCTAITPCGTYTATVTVVVSSCINNYNEPICMVTVDTATEKAEIIWGHTNSPPATGSYNIYKDTTSGFTLIHNQALNALSDYVDNSSYPYYGPETYELSTLDSCGESVLSARHTSIYLTTTSAPNVYILNWTAYVGFTPSKYRIFRGPTLGTVVQIDSVANTVLTYHDTLPPNGSVYLVEGVNPSGSCIPVTTIKRRNASSALLSGSFSNGYNSGTLITTGIMGVGNSLTNLNIYPNPANGMFTLSYSINAGSNIGISIIDELGQIIYSTNETKVAGNYAQQLNLENVASGIYTLRMETDNGSSVKKLVIIKSK